MKKDISDNILFSVVIPIFNNSEYIEQCVNSIVCLGKKVCNSDKYEILIVNDGSTDGSAQICDRLAVEYDECRVYHIQQGGVSRARNIGIKNAHGEYIVFLDADDLWDKKEKHLKAIIKIIKKDDVDLLFVGCHRGNKDGNIVKTYHLSEKEYKGGVEAIRILKYNEKHICSAWIKREFLLKYHISFPESLKYWEDKYFIHTCCWCAEKIGEVDFPLHIYRDNPTSAMNKKKDLEEEIKNMILINKAVCKLGDLPKVKSIPNEDREIQFFYQVVAVGNVMEIITFFCRNSLNVEQLRKIINDNELNYAIENYKNLPLNKHIKKQFDFYLKFPFVFSVKYKIAWKIRCIVKWILPEKLKYR